jgi:hypothetical protein
MKWKKRGLIFNPQNHELSFECNDFAQSPQTLVFDDYVRVYFSTRKKDTNGKFISHIAFVDFNKNFDKIINYSKNQVIASGELGTFDEHGIFPINPLNHDGKIWAYTCGWSRRVSVSVETSTGLVISNDNGTTFERVGIGPVLSSSLQEPMLVGDSFVKHYEGKFHMWYIFGKHWLPAENNEPPARVYKIAYATSENGLDWNKYEGIQIISDILNEHECQALPSVIKIHDKYHMFFCYRYATDFRTNPLRGYRLGYAFSHDLQNWTRDDKNKGIDISDIGWDSEMMCYPHVFQAFEKVYLLYNGNNFGKYGFGLAELETL